MFKKFPESHFNTSISAPPENVRSDSKTIGEPCSIKPGAMESLGQHASRENSTYGETEQDVDAERFNLSRKVFVGNINKLVRLSRSLSVFNKLVRLSRSVSVFNKMVRISRSVSVFNKMVRVSRSFSIFNKMVGAFIS